MWYLTGQMWNLNKNILQAAETHIFVDKCGTDLPRNSQNNYLKYPVRMAVQY